MSILRKASDASKRIPIGDDGEDWIEVRTEISKRDFNRFINFLPERQMKEGDSMAPAEAVELQRGLFATLVTAWSLEAPPTLEEYESLASDGASAIDMALGEHFASLTPSKQEEKVGFRPSE